MSALTDLRLAPIADDDRFEDLCCELWRREWKDPGAQRHGRSGQAQQGVDVFGRPDDGAEFDGIQCKAVANPLTETELQAEVDSAKAFDPPLKHLIVATTAPKDAKLEAYARRLTQAHVLQGSFSVTVLGWKDVLTLIEKHPDLIERFFEVQVQSSKVSEAVAGALEPRLYGLQQAISDQGMFQANTLLGQGLDEVRDEINAYRSRHALRRLAEFRKRYWSQADDTSKFRAACYEGEAHLALGEEDEAAKLYLEAFAYKPEDLTALSHAALAYLIAGDTAQAADTARATLARYPSSTLAAGVLINAAPPDRNLEELLSSDVPAPIRTSAEVLMNLALVSRRRGDWALAELWIREAFASDKERHPNLCGLYGEILLAKVMREASAFLSHLLHDAISQALLADAEEAFTTAWDKVSDTDLRTERLSWLINRGTARKLQGKVAEATSDFDLALQSDPEQPDALRCRAIIMLESGDVGKAADLARKSLLGNPPEQAQCALFLARVLVSSQVPEDLAEAQAALSNALEQSPSEEEREVIEAMRTDIALEQGDFERARELARRLLEKFPKRPGSLVTAARVARLAGDISGPSGPLAAGALLNWALEGAATDIHVSDLASEFYASGNYGKAAELYARIAVKGQYDALSRALLYAHYQSGRLGDALTVAKDLIAANGPLPSVSGLAAAISEKIGDLPTARQLAEQYVAAYPNDVGMQLRLATICVRQGDEAAIDRFLDPLLSADGMEVKDAILVATLLERRGQSERALRFSYTIREKFYNSHDAHLSYVMRFFRLTSRERFPMLDVLEGAQADTAVTLTEDEGPEQTYWIEGQPVRHDEFHLIPEHPLARRLIGKHQGEMVTISDTGFSTRQVTIKEIKSKYVQAFQDSSANFER